MHTSCELLHGTSQSTSLGASNLSRKASHLLATPSVRNTRCERSLANVHARRADLSVAAQAVTQTPEDLSIQTLDRPATSLAQPRCVIDCRVRYRTRAGGGLFNILHKSLSVGINRVIWWLWPIAGGRLFSHTCYLAMLLPCSLV